MKLYTIADIRALKPCYDPTKYLPDDWTGTLVDLLEAKEATLVDRIWVVTKLLDDKTNRLFAVWCAREALKLIENPDPRSVSACDVAEKFAHGRATKEELNSARAAAWAAASDAWAAWAASRAARAAASDAARAAARAAADAAASDAARAAASDAARAAAEAAARDVARAAASDAASDAARAAASDAARAAARAAAEAAASDAAEAAARDAQIEKLIEMIREGELNE